MPLRLPAPVRRAFELAERERKFLLSELVQVKGLMPMLMKRRNKQQWSPEEHRRNPRPPQAASRSSRRTS